MELFNHARWVICISLINLLLWLNGLWELFLEIKTISILRYWRCLFYEIVNLFLIQYLNILILIQIVHNLIKDLITMRVEELAALVGLFVQLWRLNSGFRFVVRISFFYINYFCLRIDEWQNLSRLNTVVLHNLIRKYFSWQLWMDLFISARSLWLLWVHKLFPTVLAGQLRGWGSHHWETHFFFGTVLVHIVDLVVGIRQWVGFGYDRTCTWQSIRSLLEFDINQGLMLIWCFVICKGLHFYNIHTWWWTTHIWLYCLYWLLL